MKSSETPRVLQLCHGYDGPFLDCARQYAALFDGTPYKITTVYLTGEPSVEVERGSASDEVIFLGLDSRNMRGLKLDAMHKVRKIIADRDFRFCIAHRFKPIYVALLATRLPVIGVHHAFGVYNRLTRRLFINRFRQRLLLLGVSNAVRDEIRAYLPAWPPERIETLYNRIDVERVQSQQANRETAREALSLPQDAWVVGNVGRLHPDKDQATLMRGFALALPRLPKNSLLIIIGRGRLEAALKALAAELGVTERVRFLGQIPDARRFFKAFDVFALASDHEPFGMVILEAMAAEIPVVCSDCGGGREVVDGVGSLFTLRDEQSLADRLVSFSSIEYSSSVGSQRLRECFTDDAARARFWHLAPALLPCDSISRAAT